MSEIKYSVVINDCTFSNHLPFSTFSNHFLTFLTKTITILRFELRDRDRDRFPDLDVPNGTLQAFGYHSRAKYVPDRNYSFLGKWNKSYQDKNFQPTFKDFLLNGKQPLFFAAASSSTKCK